MSKVTQKPQEKKILASKESVASLQASFKTFLACRQQVAEVRSKKK